SFCTPGEGHEKGGVEGEVGFFRRNHLVPVPSARNLDELNAMLLAGCREDEARTIDGRHQTVGDALAIERDHPLPLPREGFNVLDLEHYLDVLERKPGALAGSKPLEQWRQAGRWPTSYDRMWQALMQRQGRQVGTKTMIELLQLGREHGFGRLRVAIEAALELG